MACQRQCQSMLCGRGMMVGDVGMDGKKALIIIFALSMRDWTGSASGHLSWASNGMASGKWQVASGMCGIVPQSMWPLLAGCLVRWGLYVCM